jgi:cellulose biosynthesis protein BcsQ
MAANLAWCSAQISRRRTLLWDLDPANGAGFLFGIDPKKKRDAKSVMSLARSPEELIRKSGVSHLHLLPADESIRTLDRQFGRIRKPKRLSKIAAQLDKDYERIIFDCPPVLNEVSEQIFRASDLIIVPLPPSPLSTRAFDTVVGAIKQSGKKHPPILPVLSMIDMRRKLHRETREANPKWPFVPAASAIELGAIRQEAVGAFAPKSPAAQAFARLWTAIERKLAKR